MKTVVVTSLKYLYIQLLTIRLLLLAILDGKRGFSYALESILLMLTELPYISLSFLKPLIHLSSSLYMHWLTLEL